MKKYILNRWKENFAACSIQCLNILMSVLCAFTLMKIVDNLTAGNQENVQVYLVLQALCWLLTAITYYAGNILMGKAQQAMENDMRHDLTMILAKKSYQQYEKHAIGDYISWYSHDVGQMLYLGGNSFYALVTSGFQTVVSATSLLALHWSISAAAVAGALTLAGISMYFESRITEKAHYVSKSSEIFSSNMKNLLSGFGVMKNFRILDEFTKQADEESEKRAESVFQYTKIQVLSNGWLLFWNAFFQVVILAVCVFFILQGKLQVGAVVGIGSFLPKVFEGMTETLCHKNSMVAIRPYVEKFEKERAEYAAEGTGAGKFPSASRAIETCQLSYKYGEKQVFENLNIKINIGKKYALTGSSGGGKTTLMKILMGQLRDYEGQVLFDGEEAGGYSSEEIAGKIAYIEQQVYLFDTTIRNNITLWKTYSEEEMECALRESALYEEIRKFPQGLDTPVGENGKNLSGGQRQRIALARALINGRKILFVDEGTSALDMENAAVVEECLLKNRNLTLLLISHHLTEERKQQFDQVFCIGKI